MIIIFIFLLFFFLNSNSKILAVTKIPTPSPTASESPKESTGDVKETKIEDVQKIREAVQKKVQEKLNEITNTVSAKKGIIGSVLQIENNEIIISYKNNINQRVLTSKDTVFIDSNRNKTQISKIKVGQEILAMGTINQDKILEAKRIVFINIQDLEIKYSTVIGTIVDISKSSPFLVLVPINNKDIQYQIKTDNLTEMVNRNNEKFDFKTLTAGQKVVVIIKPDNKSSKTYYVSKIISLGNNKPTPSLSPAVTQ